jgi:hypothetical protein
MKSQPKVAVPKSYATRQSLFMKEARHPRNGVHDEWHEVKLFLRTQDGVLRPETASCRVPAPYLHAIRVHDRSCEPGWQDSAGVAWIVARSEFRLQAGKTSPTSVNAEFRTAAGTRAGTVTHPPESGDTILYSPPE